MAGAVGAPVGDLAGAVRPGLLRDRDDGDGGQPLRHRAVRRRGLPRLAAAVRSDDRGRPPVAQDGAGDAARVRPDARSEVGHLHGRLRVGRRRLRQLRHRPGRGSGRSSRRVRPRLSAATRVVDLRHRATAAEDRTIARARSAMDSSAIIDILQPLYRDAAYEARAERRLRRRFTSRPTVSSRRAWRCATTRGCASTCSSR